MEYVFLLSDLICHLCTNTFDNNHIEIESANGFGAYKVQALIITQSLVKYDSLVRICYRKYVTGKEYDKNVIKENSERAGLQKIKVMNQHTIFTL